MVDPPLPGVIALRLRVTGERHNHHQSSSRDFRGAVALGPSHQSNLARLAGKEYDALIRIAIVRMLP